MAPASRGSHAARGALLSIAILLELAGAPNTTDEAVERFQHRCDADATPMLHPDPKAPHSGEAALHSTTEVRKRAWRPDWAFTDRVVETETPIVLHGTIVDLWDSRNWTWEHLQELYAGETVKDVELTEGHLFMKPDAKAPLGTLFRYHLPLRLYDMDGSELFTRMEEIQRRYESMGSPETLTEEMRKVWRTTGQRLGTFTTMPNRVVKELQPEDWLYVTHRDLREARQLLWVTSPGIRTHTHFDDDHNFNIQVIGRKRWVLWPPNQTRNLCPFPRLHPLRHKSRVDFELPDQRLQACNEYSLSEAMTVDVEPGDVLYVPPFWWHTVETISPSASLSTLSMFKDLMHHMRSMYDLKNQFDFLIWYDARVYSLRVYLSLLLQKVLDIGQDDEHDFFAEVLQRYDGLEGELHAVPHDDDETLCVIDKRGTPTCQHCLEHANWDAQIVHNHLYNLPLVIRRQLLEDYVEFISVPVVGVDRVQHFWRDCFRGQHYFKTKKGTWEHKRLWERTRSPGDYADLDEDDWRDILGEAGDDDDDSFQGGPPSAQAQEGGPSAEAKKVEL